MDFGFKPPTSLSEIERITIGYDFQRTYEVFSQDEDGNVWRCIERAGVCGTFSLHKKASNKDTSFIDKNPKVIKKKHQPHMMYGFALPYLIGAKMQLDRYREITPQLKTNTPYAVYMCMHETSCLFEDLVTVGRYAEMAGDTHPSNQLWLDVRNHIRHDIREEFDKEDSQRKNDRAKRLGLNPKLQTSISYAENHIRVGSTVITLAEIENYLGWAGGVIAQTLSDAKEKGLITDLPPPKKDKH